MWESAINLFRRACGLEAPWVLRCEEAGPDHEVETRSRLALPFVLIGRDQDQGPPLSARDVSRRHALLQMIGGRLRVIDLQSRTGVEWENPIEAPEGDRYLEAGQVIRIGPYRLSWSRGGEDERAPAEPEGDDAPPIASSRSLALSPRAPEGAFVMPIRMGDEEPLWRVDDDLTLIGRSESCRMVLNDKSVSRLHAVVARTPLGVWIVDAGSREGVVVSGVRVRWAWLDDGDTVRLGRFTFVFRYLTPTSGIHRGDVPFAAGAWEEGSGGGSRSRGGQNGGRELATRSPSGRSPQSVVRVSPSVITSLGPTARRQPNSDAVWTAPSSEGGIPVEIWQRQMEMMESFHNDMIAMVQTLFTIHREQHASVREEMTRVEELTAELDALRRKMSHADADSGAAGRASASPRPAPAQKASPRDHSARDQEAAGPAARSRTDPKPASAAAASRPSPAAPPREEKAPVASPEMHGFIADRIASLQRERQGYWRRILNQIHS